MLGLSFRVSHVVVGANERRLCNEFIPYSDLQQQAKVIPTEFKLEFQSSIHKRNEKHVHSKTKSKITSCDHVTNCQKSISTKGGPLNSAQAVFAGCSYS